MNCLTYLLDLWSKGYFFKLMSDENHYIGVTAITIYDHNNLFKKELLLGEKTNYLIMDTRAFERISRAFELTEKQKEILYEILEQ